MIAGGKGCFRQITNIAELLATGQYLYPSIAVQDNTVPGVSLDEKMSLTFCPRQ